MVKVVLRDKSWEVKAGSTVRHIIEDAGLNPESILALRDGILPPTINLDNPDPECDLDYVPNTARTAKVDVVLKNSFGMGNQNACLVLKRH